LRLLSRAGAVVLSALAMLGFLLAIASASFGRPDGAVFYVAVTLVSGTGAAILMRREMRHRRAEEAALPMELRPPRRTPRRAITFPLRETTITFALWYGVAVVVDRAVTGSTSAFTLGAIAPFAAFILTTLTVAGRHMAFRLTAEEAADAAARGPDQGSA